MAMSGGSDDGEPMMEMNTTPLIDVLSAYLTTDRTLAVIKDSGVTKFGFVGNEQYGSFNKAKRPPN